VKALHINLFFIATWSESEGRSGSGSGSGSGRGSGREKGLRSFAFVIKMT